MLILRIHVYSSLQANATENKVYYRHPVQDNQVYSEADDTYSSAGPNYDTVPVHKEPMYDKLPPAIDVVIRTVEPSAPVVHSSSRTVGPSASVVHSSSSRTVEPSAPVVHTSSRTVVVREEVPDQFHNTEQHIYAAVNKKHKKQAEQEKTDLADEEEEIAFVEVG